MDVDDYFDKVNKRLDNLSDDELFYLLSISGIDLCPLDEE